MQQNYHIRQLDESLSTYISSNDALRKSASRTVFMKKKQLFTFYGKMVSKAHQQLKLQQKQNTTSDSDRNKLLWRQEKRTKQKIYSRTFYTKKQSSNIIHLNSKKNLNVNLQPLVFNQSLNPLRIKRNLQSEDQINRSQDNFITKSIKQNENFKSRKTKSLSCNLSLLKKQKSSLKQIQDKTLIQKKQQQSYCQHQQTGEKNLQLISLYQKLFHQFQVDKSQILKGNSKLKHKSNCKKLILTKNSSKIIKNNQLSEQNRIQIKI